MSMPGWLSWTTAAACLAVGFAGGAWWGSRNADRTPGGMPAATTHPALAPAAPAALSSLKDRGILAEVTETPGGPTAATDGMAASTDRVDEDPQVAWQRAAAESSSGAGEAVSPAPTNPWATTGQSSMQPAEPIAPAPTGTGSMPAPPGVSAQLSAQSGAAL